ncbi:hypothetical protein FQN52_003845 [Onygenales sp. PD_12]|nr:hypothetical protein FQN52_003845 [Onygenales sp. PD_12]KAK2776023.1 hypothetical protein FQN53_002917 [Emmonsiellopsis sp. PD_33]KAK2787394.1 hypothetical protein FQN51_003169 [Onygenales sp. PD_10]
MRWHLLVLASSAATAAAAPSLGSIIARLSPKLSNDEIPKFQTLPLEDAKAGKDLLDKMFNLTDILPQMEDPGVSTFSTAACNANPARRIEWRSYSTSDRRAFMNAIKCMIDRPSSGSFSPAKNRYEDFARLHQMYMNNIHGNEKFLIWHRYLLWTWEQVLRDECGFDRALPWWDETKDAGRFAQSTLFNGDNFGSLPSSAACITNGAFAGLTCNIGPGNQNRPHCLARSVDEGQTSNCNSDYVRTCNSRNTYAEMHSCAETGPHAYGHNGIGNIMADVSSSPSDPIFWMHHTFIDRNFRVWQNVDPARRTTINGNDATGTPLTMDTPVNVGPIFAATKIRDIMDTMSGVTIGGKTFCYRYDY